MPPIVTLLPKAEEFPDFPVSWYWMALSSEISQKPKPVRLFGRDLVAFRDEKGSVVVMDSRCSHMGADLSQGCVVNGKLQCPFHGWKYGSDGVCTEVPRAKEPPTFAKQKTCAVAERNGNIFVFNGPKPLFPMPFFFGENSDEYVTAKPFTFNAKSTWYMIAAHAFDVQHFETVHDRKLLAPPVIDCPAPFGRRCTHHSEVIGVTVFDRLLRIFGGKTVTVEMTIWGNNFCMVEGRFPKVTSRFFLMMNPLDDGTTQIVGIVFRKRSKIPLIGPIVDYVGLNTRRLFTSGYLNDENVKLGSPEYRPATMVEQDREMVAYFQWAAALCKQAEVSGP
jgi:nitrite reductase/ring-hydroxylating ferredoxin subunit